MRAPPNGLAVAVCSLILIGTLVVVGAPHDRRAAPPPVPAPPLPSSVGAGGMTLASAAIELPSDDRSFPAGNGSEIADQVCTACHSTSMVLSQPALTPQQWADEVKKMREVYKARMTDAEAQAITGYMASLTPPGRS